MNSYSMIGANVAPPTHEVSPQFGADLVALMPYLLRLSRKLCGSRGIAEDMAQEALAKAWRARARFEPGTNLTAWLFTILRNELYSHDRRAWREAHWEVGHAEGLTTPGGEQEWAMELSDTARAIGHLPKQQQEALVLIAVDGASYEDAATTFGTAVGTMKSRVARGRTALREMLDGKLPMSRRPGRAAAVLSNRNPARHLAAFAPFGRMTTGALA